MIRRPPISRLCPYTTLFRSSEAMARQFWPGENPVGKDILIGPNLGPEYQVGITQVVGVVGDVRDRKSTRLNSSHPSHLVCRLLLEKKKKDRTRVSRQRHRLH